MILDALWSFLDLTWILTALIGLLTLTIVRHLMTVRALPPGPFPLPVVGNLLFLNISAVEIHEMFHRYTEKFGKMFSVWFGPTPTIVVSGWELCKEGLINKRNDFSGRFSRHSLEVFIDGASDVIFTDYGPCWENLRRILSLAVRKYSVSEKLSELVTDIVDEVGEEMVKEGKPVDTNDYTYLTMYSILACSTFGKRYGLKDPEFQSLRSLNDRLNDLFEAGLPSDFALFLKYIFYKKERRYRNTCREWMGHFERKYQEHKDTYKKGTIRDFTDAVLSAREEAEEESKDSRMYLTDKNVVSLTMDLFSAGTETTRTTINWLLLYACNYPEVQDRMRKEIDDNIGTRGPVHSDRDNCPYIHAAITEILRVRPVLDFTLEHKSICDTELGDYKIKQGTSVMFNIRSCHQDPSLWPEPDAFKPERFLDTEGRFTNARLVGYMPFGLGRRACPGDKLGLVNVFLVIVRLLQNYTFELDGVPGTADLQPKVLAFINIPKPYKVVVKRREKL